MYVKKIQNQSSLISDLCQIAIDRFWLCGQTKTGKCGKLASVKKQVRLSQPILTGARGELCVTAWCISVTVRYDAGSEGDGLPPSISRQGGCCVKVAPVFLIGSKTGVREFDRLDGRVDWYWRACREARAAC